MRVRPVPFALALTLMAAMATQAFSQSAATASAAGKVVQSVPSPKITVPAPTTIELTNQGGAIGETTKLVASLLSKPPDVNAKFLGREVKFFVDGKDACTAKIATLNLASCPWKVPDMTQGTKTLEARFAGDSTWAASKASAQILVVKAISKLSLDPTEYGVYRKVTSGEALKFGALLTRTTDKEGIDGRLVKFSVNGQPTGKGTTIKGWAELTYQVPKDIPGDVNVEAFFEGDEFYLPSSDKHSFGVWHIKNGYLNILSAPDGSVGQRLTYRAQLTEAPAVPGMQNANGVSGQKIEFIFDHWDGREWSAGWNIQGVTDKNGVASATDKPATTYGNLRVRVDSDSNWRASEVSKYVSIGPSATDVSVSNASGDIGQTVALKARVTRASDGSPRSSVRVVFEVGGFTVAEDRTDASGNATANLKLSSGLGIGKHVLNARTAGDLDNKVGAGSASLTVGASHQ